MAHKKQKLNDGSLPSLSDDLIFYEIFPRLPAKSLHRFRCVSTSFRRLTSDLNFLSAFRRHAPRRQLFSFSCDLPTKLALYSADPLAGPDRPAAVLARALENPSHRCTYVKVINGLMCQVNQGLHVIISNNATNEKTQLPGFEPLPSENDRLFFYFCHDPETDAYKVLRTTAIGSYRNEHTAIMKYSIFTLGSGAWRDFDLPELLQFKNSRSVCVNGILYLNKFRDVDGHNVIAAFVVKRDRFCAVRYPNGLPRSRYNDCYLIEVKGALAIIDVEDFMRCEIRLWIKGKGSRSDDGWVERKIEFDSRWETLYNLSLNYCFSVNGNGEILMGSTKLSSSDECWVFVYNMESREWRRVEIEGINKCAIVGDLSIEEYVENPLLISQVLQPRSTTVVIDD